MADFVYENFLQEQYAGFSIQPGSWVSLNMALVNTGYTPDQATDSTLSSIPGGALAADGHTGTVPTFTYVFNGSGAVPEAGIQATIVTGVWGTVPSGAPVNAVVLYAVIESSPFETLLIAYYDDWAGLPFTPNGTNVTLVSLPTPLQTNGVNLVRAATA